MQAEPAPIRSKAVSNGTTSARLGGARADFVGGLGRKVADLRATFARAKMAPADGAARDELRRKLHALSSAAKMMKFDAMDRGLAEALGVFDRTPPGAPLEELDLDTIEETIEDLPALAWSDGPAHASRATRAEESAAARHRVLVVGTPLIAEPLLEAAPGASAAFACESTPDPQTAFDLVRTTEPDLLLVDADLSGAAALVEGLLSDPLTEAVPVIVVGSFLEAGEAARYIALGVAKTVSKPTARETLRAVCEETLSPAHTVFAVPSVPDEPTLEELSDRLASELREALVGRADPSARTRRIPLGEGTEVLGAVWGAIARVREIVVSRTDGQVRFAGGPEGALTPAGLLHEPEAARGDRHHGTRRGLAAEVRLDGRRVVVADDDPAVVWFLADLLRTAGCVVHEAFDGQQALERAYESSPDLVISDILMPNVDGFSLCRTLRRDVALRDTPVILLSWKEDLLQRVRELGAGAAAYVRKESDTRAIIARVREALRARGRVEARLREDVEVRGRLDDVSTRTLLELVAATRPDARVSVRDATFLYEVELRSGAPRRATRTDGGGRFLKGPKALAQLLGVRAGRFTVTTCASSIEGDLEGSLAAQLAEPIARARAATTLLTGPRMHAIARVRLDERALACYLEATPERARVVARRLANGASPRELVFAGGCEPALLDDILCDLAARGLVTEIEGADGADLLHGEVAVLLRNGGARPASGPATDAPAPAAALADDTSCAREPSAPMCTSPTPGATASLGEAVLRELSADSPEPAVVVAAVAHERSPEPSEVAQRAETSDDREAEARDDREAQAEAGDDHEAQAEAGDDVETEARDDREAEAEARDDREAEAEARDDREAEARDDVEAEARDAHAGALSDEPPMVAAEEKGTPLPEPSVELTERTGLEGTEYVERVDPATAEIEASHAASDELTPFAAVASSEATTAEDADDGALHKRWTKIACAAAAGLVAWAMLYYWAAHEDAPKQQGVQLYAPEPETPLPLPAAIEPARASAEAAARRADDGVEAEAEPAAPAADAEPTATAPGKAEGRARPAAPTPKRAAADSELHERHEHDEHGCTSGVHTSRVTRASM